MKKYVLVFTILALLQVSCSKDNNEPGFKEDRVFQESQFMGYWQHFQTKEGDSWISTAYACEKAFIEFKGGNVFNNHKCFLSHPEAGTWTFNGKNVLKYEEKYGVIYQLNLIDISGSELIAEVNIITENGYEEKQTRKYKKMVSTLDDYYKYFTYGFRVKDTSNFIPMGANPELRMLTGVKDNKMWIGYFDANTKEQIYEKKDKEDFIFTKQIHKGYGEYETFTINNISVANAFNDNLFLLDFHLSNENTNDITSTMLWFSASGKKIDCENNNFSVTPWYNKSYIVRYYDSVACLSHEGDSILSGSKFYFPGYESELYPINYNYFITAVPSGDAIYFSVNQMFVDGNTSWNREETKVEAEQSNFKYTVTVVEKNSSIWKFKVDITEYSGKKHSHTVEIDVSVVNK